MGVSSPDEGVAPCSKSAQNSFAHDFLVSLFLTLGRNDGIAKQHGDGHGSNAARDRGDPSGDLMHGIEIHIAYDLAPLSPIWFREIDMIDPNINDGGARL